MSRRTSAGGELLSLRHLKYAGNPEKVVLIPVAETPEFREIQKPTRSLVTDGGPSRKKRTHGSKVQD